MRSALTKTPGVISAEVAMPDKADIKYDKSKVTIEKLIAAVAKAGNQYSAAVREAEKK